MERGVRSSSWVLTSSRFQAGAAGMVAVVAALLAWPIARGGLDPETAALISGRSISMAGMAMTLAGAFFLARHRLEPDQHISLHKTCRVFKGP